LNNLATVEEMISNSVEFYKNLHKSDSYSYSPVLEGSTELGNKLSLGFSTFGLKMSYMSGEWECLTENKQLNWTNYINSFQSEKEGLPKNSYVDKVLYEFYNNTSVKQITKDVIKNIVNVFSQHNIDTNKVKFQKTVNAETKQALASLFQVGYKNSKPYLSEHSTSDGIEIYLNSLNWKTPWSSGAQFASLCVYSKIDSLKNVESLTKFADSIANADTGSYFKKQPSHSREVINGAMKMLSGFDWIGLDIHYPEKLIDYCLSNTPVTEGCDIVDFIYVLYRCSKQTNYKKKEVLDIMNNSIDKIKSLYHKKSGGFSYFLNKSQTHYYGVPISIGQNVPDIHGTLLCVWGLLMILDANEKLNSHYKIIKP